MSIYPLINVPHADDKNKRLEVAIEGETICVWCVDKTQESPYDRVKVCDLYVGEHMFAFDRQYELRLMIGRSIVSAIEQARDRGYDNMYGECRIKLPAHFATQRQLRMLDPKLRDQEYTGNEERIKDTDRCDLYQWDGFEYIVQLRVT